MTESGRRLKRDKKQGRRGSTTKSMIQNSTPKKIQRQSQKTGEQKPHTSLESCKSHNHQGSTTDWKGGGEETSFYAALDWR